MAMRSRAAERPDEVDDFYPSLFADVYPLPPDRAIRDQGQGDHNGRRPATSTALKEYVH